MTRDRMNASWTLSLLLIALGAVGCSKQNSSPGGAEEVAKVRVALNWVPEPEFGGIYAAKSGGAYRSHGLDVEVIGGGAGVPVVQMVATGRVEFGTAGGDDVVMARARGADVVAVFATFQTAPQGIMVHASRHFESLEEVFRDGRGMLALE